VDKVADEAEETKIDGMAFTFSVART
jgi:hypothetical protein